MGKAAWFERARGYQSWRGNRYGGRSALMPGTREPYLRAYDSGNGAELWKGELPFPAQSTPMTYESNSPTVCRRGCRWTRIVGHPPGGRVGGLYR